MSKKYTDEDKRNIIVQVLEHMTEMSLTQACDKVGVPKSTVWQWIGKDPDTGAQYARARSLYADNLFEKMIYIAFEEPLVTNANGIDNAAVQDKRCRIDTIKWILARAKPDKYGDRLQLAGDKDNPLNIVGKVERVVIVANGQQQIEQESNKDKEVAVISDPHPFDSKEKGKE